MYEVAINMGQIYRRFTRLSHAMKFYGDSILKNENEVVDFYQNQKLVSRWTINTGFIEY